MNRSFEVNGVTLEYNFMDADEMDRYEDFLNNIKAGFDAQKPESFKRKSDEIRACCKIVKDEFEKLFDPDTCEKVLPGNDFGACMNAITVMTAAYTESITDIKRGYGSEKKPMNRAERRAQQFKNRQNQKHTS